MRTIVVLVFSFALLLSGSDRCCYKTVGSSERVSLTVESPPLRVRWKPFCSARGGGPSPVSRQRISSALLKLMIILTICLGTPSVLKNYIEFTETSRNKCTPNRSSRTSRSEASARVLIQIHSRVTHLIQRSPIIHAWFQRFNLFNTLNSFLSPVESSRYASARLSPFLPPVYGDHGNAVPADLVKHFNVTYVLFDLCHIQTARVRNV